MPKLAERELAKAKLATPKPAKVKLAKMKVATLKLAKLKLADGLYPRGHGERWHLLGGRVDLCLQRRHKLLSFF